MLPNDFFSPVWSRESKRALALSTIAFSICFAVWGLIGALAPTFRDLYHLSPMELSFLIAIPVLLGSVGRIPMGMLADKYGGRIVFGLLLLVSFIFSIGAGCTTSYYSLIVWGFLIGFAGSSFAVGVAFASKWFEARHQGTALGIYGIGNIGQSLATSAAPALVVTSGDWRLPFWIFGGIAGLFGIAFLLLARDAPVKERPRRLSEALGVLRREKLAWVLSTFYFLTFGGFVALSIYLPTLLRDIFGLTLADAGLRVAGFVAVATLVRPLGGWLADRCGGVPVLASVLGLVAVTSLGLMATNMVAFTAGALGTAALLGAGNGAVFRLVPEYFPRETGTVTGLVGAAGGLGGFFPPIVLGMIRKRTGSYDIGFILLSGFALICLALHYFVFQRKKRDRGNAVAEL